MILKYLNLFLLLIIISSAFAQKVKYDGESINYTQYPLKPLPKEFKTYRIFHEGFDMNQTIGKNNGFTLKNYEKVRKDEDFKIKVNFSSVNIEVKPEFIEKNFYNVFYVTFDAQVEITDPVDIIIDTIILLKLDRVKYSTSGPFANEYTAVANADLIKPKIRDEVFRSAEFKVNDRIKERIDIRLKKLALKSGYLKDDAELVAASGKFNEQVKILISLKYDGTDKIDKEELNKILSVWEERSIALDTINKDSEGVYQMYKYNMAMVYFLLGNYEKSKEYMAEVMRIHDRQSIMSQLKLLHMYNFHEMLKTHEMRLKSNGLL